MSELEELMKVFGEAGGDSSILVREDIAHFVASGHKILSTRATQGLEIQAEETATGIAARVRVLEGTIIKNPIHLCFGLIIDGMKRSKRKEIERRVGYGEYFLPQRKLSLVSCLKPRRSCSCNIMLA